MKKLPLKWKLTILYTAFMTILTVVMLGVLLSLSSSEILSSVEQEMEEKVFGVSEDIQWTGKRLQLDRDFYATSGGGITLSGGEPLVRPALAAGIVRLARKRGLHTAIDTCGWFDMDDPEAREALANCDLLLFDLKHMESSKHKACTRMDNARILENLDRMAREFPNLPIWIRTPIVRGFNDSEQEVLALARHAAQYPNVQRHELLPCLDIGEDKYAQFGMARPQFASIGPDPEQLARLQALVAQCRNEMRMDEGGSRG